ncbi:putative lipoprotein [Treponema primitia ZAS-2]|uniref:Putative lipoprotein n=1 Tax=Treponema primitia (strain ATCC BAA-887 / DSM 12427 / ZAS-2) TaxID=545694 RepID=F5YHW1_TREPZ|nr:leucine-rich repeat domain-containing protein [Treponema primitia]AEF84808.1 putative lipoprotein [Treponema primitia ZAS-2]
MRKPLFIAIISLFMFTLIFGSCENPENSTVQGKGLEQNNQAYQNSGEEKANPDREKSDPKGENSDPNEENADPDEESADSGGENTGPGKGNADSGDENTGTDGKNSGEKQEEAVQEPGLPGKLFITVSPEEFTHYTLSFLHQSGDTTDDLKLPPENEGLMLDLAAGLWTITAVAYVNPGTGDPIPAAQGLVQVQVIPEKIVEVSITLDKMLGGEGSRGTLSYSVEFPQDLVRSALLTLFARDEDGVFRPCFITDLLESAAGNVSEGAIVLNPGYYRLDLTMNALYHRVTKTEYISIYPYGETRTTDFYFDPADFPPVTEITDTVALTAYLKKQSGVTETNPCLIRVGNVDLSISANSASVKALYSSLSQYTALDLRDCSGASLINSTAKTTPTKVNMVALILPVGLRTLSANVFSDCPSLVLADLPGVTTINNAAFSGCGKLESVNMPEVTAIKNDFTSTNGAFQGCKILKSVYLPKALKLERDTFRSCKALSVVYLPQVNTLAEGAFEDCSALDCLILGETPPKLGKEVFKDSNPRTIYVPQSAIDTYKTTTQQGWTPGLKEKVRALPEKI